MSLKSFSEKGSVLLVAIFALALAYTLWAATVGWDAPIVQQYEFVQAKAAIGAYYIARGGPILRYELPVFGPPWSVPYEFPIYQMASAWTHNFVGVPLESAGRLVAKFFFYLTCIPLWMIARAVGFRGKTVFIPLTLFLISPIYLFWSRQFMNEATALFFGMAYLALVISWGQKASDARLFAALFLGILAAVSKSTTFATFGLISGLYLCNELYRSYSVARLVRSFLIVFLPLLAGLLWVRYSDSIKGLNPLAADTHTSTALAKWYLHSDWSERTSGALWYHFFRITIHDSIGHRAVWIFSVILAFFLGRKAWLYWLSSALFLVAPLLFTHAHLLHDYYANASAIFLVFAIAVLVERMIASDKKWVVILGFIFFGLTISYDVREYMHKGFVQQQERRMAPILFGKKIKALVAPSDVLLMYGEDWCPVIPFYSERRAIMLQNGTWYNPRLSESLALLKAEGKKVGAVILCHEARTDPVLLSRVSLGPLLFRDLCDVYAVH